MGLYVVALDALDVGISVMSPASGEILLANSTARRYLRAFTGDGSDPTHIPPTIRGLFEASSQPTSKFTHAVPVTALDGRRFFVRRRLVDGPSVLFTIASAELREVDIRRVLADHFGLSARECKVAYMACQGYLNREIAEELDLVEGTVKNYLTRVFQALAVRNRTELGSELHQLLDEQTDVHRRGE